LLPFIVIMMILRTSDETHCSLKKKRENQLIAAAAHSIPRIAEKGARPIPTITQ
jgi:hypothetical protein